MGEAKERWEQLCELAQSERDPKILMKLLEELNRLLAEKDRKLQRPSSSPSD